MAPPRIADATARQLTTQISRARNVHDVLALVHSHLESFDHIHTTSCLYKLAQRRGTFAANDSGKKSRDSKNQQRWDMTAGQRRVFDALVQEQVRYFRDYALDGRQLANTIWAAATLSTVARLPPGFLHGVANELGKLSDSLNHQDVANSLWAMAVLEESGKDAVSQLASSRAMKNPARFKPQELSNSSWALATCSFGGASHVRLPLVTEAAAQRSSELEPQHVSNVIWAIAAADVQTDDRTLGVLAGEARQKLAHFKPQEVSNTSWALATATVGAVWAPVMGPLASAAVVRLPEMNHQELVNVAWAFAETLPRPLSHRHYVRLGSTNGTMSPEN